MTAKPNPTQPESTSPQNVPGPVGSPSPIRGGFKTDYFIEIRGAFQKHGRQTLIINGSTRCRLQLLDFLVLFHLACQARTQAGLVSPITVFGGDTLTARQLVSLVTLLKRREPGLNGAAEDLTEASIHKAKLRIRQRLGMAGAIPDLLEFITGEGYRISTPPERIKITLLDEDDGDQSWGW